MADTTTVLAMPFPEGSDANDVPADIQALAERIDEVPGIESLTSAKISGLAAGEKPAGRVVYNSTTSKLQVSNGTTFADIDAAALLKAGGTMSGAIAMGSNKVTGLAAGTTAGDAVRYEQALLLAGGTMAGAIAMGGSKVTGLAAATANGDAVRYEQITPKLDSARVTSGVWAGTTDASGDATITLPTSPTGNWAVTLTPKPDSFSDWRTAHIKAVTSTSVSFRLFKFNVSVVTAATSDSTCDVHYIAVAY